MLDAITIEGDTFTLVQTRPEGAAALFSLTDKNRNYLRQWLPWLDHTKQESDTLQFIEGTVATAEKGKGLHFSIWMDSILVGVVGFNSLDKADRKGVIGYWLGEEFNGKGIMTKACKLLVDYGFKTLSLHRIEIRCATENTKSCNIPIRLGFVHEGTVRDAEWLYDHFVSHHIYGLLQNEWESN